MSVAELNHGVAQLKDQLRDVERYINNLTGGKKSAGVEARNSLSEMGKTANNLRKSILAYREAMPTKSRIKKEPLAAVVEPVVEEEMPPPAPVLEREATVKLKKTRAKKIAHVTLHGAE